MLYYYGPWVSQASCRDHQQADPDVWFDNPSLARSICLKCPVKDECLFTALELIQRGEPIKGIWGGLSAIQLRRALKNPTSIPKMRGQRSRAKKPPIFLIPLIPEPLTRSMNGDKHEAVEPIPMREWEAAHGAAYFGLETDPAKKEGAAIDAAPSKSSEKRTGTYS